MVHPPPGLTGSVARMKVRVGIGVSSSTADVIGPALAAITDLGFDSLWLPELLTGDAFDPMVALAWAAARYPALKLGTTMLLPGRNLVRLAKQLASLDALSNGRLLVTFVPGINRGAEASAIGLPLGQRRSAMAEALPVLRRLLAGQETSHEGSAGGFEAVRLRPLPVQQPLEFWLGGSAPRSLELCGQLADGWLPSLLTPEQAQLGRERVQAAAAAAGREIDPEHFGVSIGYSRTPLSDDVARRLADRAGGTELARLVPIGPDALRTMIGEFVAAGMSKFVLRPMGTADYPAELARLADEVLDLQT